MRHNHTKLEFLPRHANICPREEDKFMTTESINSLIASLHHAYRERTWMRIRPTQRSAELANLSLNALSVSKSPVPLVSLDGMENQPD